MSVIQTNALLFVDDQPEFLGQYRVLAMSYSPALCHVACVATTKNSATVAEESVAVDAAGSGRNNAPIPQEKGSRLSRIQTVATERLRELEDNGQLRAIRVQPHPHLTVDPNEMTSAQRRTLEARARAMRPFFQPKRLAAALRERRGIARLIYECVELSGVSRQTIHRYFWLLCQYGFEEKSLNSAFEKCGSPGKARPSPDGIKRSGRPTLRKRLGIVEKHPQVGVTEVMRQRVLAVANAERRPGMKDREIYRLVIERAFVTEYRMEGQFRIPILPEQGTYINERQFRHLLKFETTNVQRMLARTTKGHAARNYRGLIGSAWEGVFGPGHTYAIDSTIADVYLRSSVNRAWIIGRPVLYIVVDVWSSAVVGFYLCLTGPSWATAQVCLFNSFADPTISSDLWGLNGDLGLSPIPSVCAELWADRGEYLSEGGRTVANSLGFDIVHTASNRPDLRGAVEVMHRIVKNEQLMFLPGTHDARLKERELRGSRARESAMTVREYVQALMAIFVRYNVASDRNSRMTAEMIAYNVHPSPAGLWFYGHTIAQRGYRKAVPQDSLISTLLPEFKLTVRKNGIYFGRLPYEMPRESAESWTVRARNFGTFETAAFAYPGAAKTIWWKDPSGTLQPLSLAHRAPVTPITTHDEWVDALTSQQVKGPDFRHERLAAAMRCQATLVEIGRRAKEETAQAIRDASPRADKPTMTEARSMEAIDPTPVAPEPSTAANPVTQHYLALAKEHANLMRELMEDAGGRG